MNTIESAVDFAIYLKCRWADESKYESFDEYENAMTKRLPEGSTLTKFSRRPWRIEFTLADGTRKWINITATKATWGGYKH